MPRYVDVEPYKGMRIIANYEDEGILIDEIQLPEADVVKVVRCQDCVHYKATDTGCWCDMALNLNDAAVKPQHYCSKGERRIK